MSVSVNNIRLYACTSARLPSRAFRDAGAYNQCRVLSSPLVQDLHPTPDTPRIKSETLQRECVHVIELLRDVLPRILQYRLLQTLNRTCCEQWCVRLSTFQYRMLLCAYGRPAASVGIIVILHAGVCERSHERSHMLIIMNVRASVLQGPSPLGARIRTLFQS